MSQFANKIVVVSGASRGIGRAISIAFAKQGAQTVLAASSRINLESVADEIRSTGGLPPLLCAGDLRSEDGCREVWSATTHQFGKCDVLVNSAGATQAGAFLSQTHSQWEDGFALKFYSCVRLCRAFWPLLRSAQGHVVNIVGGAARNPDPEFLIGGAVNAAVSNFSKGLSQLGKREGVNVNVIHPGITETERLGQLLQERATAAGTTPDAIKAGILSKQGTKRIVQPNSIAALALFLASDAARDIQGTATAIDGGSNPGVY